MFSFFSLSLSSDFLWKAVLKTINEALYFNNTYIGLYFYGVLWIRKLVSKMIYFIKKKKGNTLIYVCAFLFFNYYRKDFSKVESYLLSWHTNVVLRQRTIKCFSFYQSEGSTGIMWSGYNFKARRDYYNHLECTFYITQVIEFHPLTPAASP